MTRLTRAGELALIFGSALIQAMELTGPARAAEPVPCPGRTVVISRARPSYARSATLGTFQPTPYLTVAGSYPTGSGYTPLGLYTDNTLSLYGPLSPLRVATAPVLGYVRGYDGQIHLVETNSFSYPNLPEVSPVVYPTGANYFYGPRVPRSPQWGSSAINWIDQN